jgi:hypothetical protein
MKTRVASKKRISKNNFKFFYPNDICKVFSPEKILLLTKQIKNSPKWGCRSRGAKFNASFLDLARWINFDFGKLNVKKCLFFITAFVAHFIIKNQNSCDSPNLEKTC